MNLLIIMEDFMKIIFNEKEKNALTKKIYLYIFKEDNVPDEVLESAICESYCDDEHTYKTFEEIPMEYKIEAIEDCCTASGMEFEDYDDILNFFHKKCKH